MVRLANSLFLLLAGTALGWWLHGVLDPTPVPKVEESPSNIVVSSPERLELPPLTAEPDSSQAAVTRPDGADRSTVFRQLLEQHEFDAAVDYYSESVQLDERYAAMLRPALDRLSTTNVATPRRASSSRYSALVPAQRLETTGAWGPP